MNLATGRATVDYAPDSVGVEELRSAVEGTGYGVEVGRYDFGVTGMSCASCVGRVERAISSVPGVVGSSVNLATERASVEYLPGQTSTRDFERAVEGAGYGFVGGEASGGDDESSVREAGMASLRWSFLLAAVLTALIFLGASPICSGS